MATSTSKRLDVSELDYDQIRNNLKLFLQNQAEYSDYDFEGSGMAVLLDLLAYNTHYLAYNANMLSNELYLDSADIRKNVVALAKQLGYTPTSVVSPQAVVDITVNNVPAGTASITMAKGTAFETTVDDVTYQYLTNAEITITPSDGVYTFSNVDIFEGTLVSFRYAIEPMAGIFLDTFLNFFKFFWLFLSSFKISNSFHFELIQTFNLFESSWILSVIGK